jgi:HPr kinase/phosphorylase
VKSEKNSLLDVKEFFQRTKDLLRIKPASGRVGFARELARSSLNKAPLPLQIWGKKEINDMAGLSPAERKKKLRKKLKEETFCVILAGGARFFPEVLEEAKRNGLALFLTELSSRRCREAVTDFISSISPDVVKISAGLLRILSLGILIRGDSGIGKSECVLELISRGHRFVCDDVVQVKKDTNGKLMGTAPRLSRNFMEIRGLGIINIKEIFGTRSVLKQSGIDLVIKLSRLKKIQQDKEQDRLGLKFPEDYVVLGVKVPQITIPVAPGRNIATLIEVACKVHVLRRRGYHAPQDIVRRLERVLSHQ